MSCLASIHPLVLYGESKYPFAACLTVGSCELLYNSHKKCQSINFADIQTIILTQTDVQRISVRNNVLLKLKQNMSLCLHVALCNPMLNVYCVGKKLLYNPFIFICPNQCFMKKYKDCKVYVSKDCDCTQSFD